MILAVAALSLLAAAEPGLPAGSRIPEFRLEDHTGVPRTFADLRGSKGLMLVFMRSADWCPFCKAQLVELEQQRPTLESKGLRIAVITYDPRPALAHFAARRKLGYPMLSDPDSKTIRAFGVLNESAKDSPAYGVPYSGSFLITPKGIIKSKHFESDGRERFPAGTVLLREFGSTLGRTSTARTPRLAVTTSASSDSVFPGHRVTLTADIELPAKMHLYAPGVSGYKPLEWDIHPSPGAAAAPAIFPPARTLRLKAIGETVPVYEKRVRLVRDLTVATGAAAREALKSGVLEVEGVLRYQACDDKQCYLPESLPLKWTFQVQKPDSERVPAELRGKVK